ncbi:MAG: nuclease-related domain-containing protein [Candidatus Bathyarchaeia archaeon]
MMQFEHEIILAVLKLAKNGPIQKNLIAKEARTSTAVTDGLLRTLNAKGFVQLKGKFLEIAPNQKLPLAVEAIRQGLDIERACKFLKWKEFENIAAEAFETNHYRVMRNFHFKACGKRWEIDLLAFNQPIIVCVDCKHWQHGWSKAAIVKTVEAQVERAQALADKLEIFVDTLGLSNWVQATLIPVVLSLIPSAFKFHNNTPVVPVLQMQNFINELPAHLHLLTRFSTIIHVKNAKLTEF